MRIAAATACSYPLRRGNSVRPLIDGLPAFRAILAAVENAKSSVYVTVAFLDEDLVLPDNHGSFFDVLERAATRGLDVRVLFWSEPEIAKLLANSAHFPAGQRNFAVLAENAPTVLARWDRLPDYCHHQKSWLIDAGCEGEIAFVGGINLDHDSIVSPRHPHGEAAVGDSIHDVYVALRGPSATDVHHNFVQRWNEASERHAPYGAYPSLSRADDLSFPQKLSREAGFSAVQVARTVRGGIYHRDVAAPEARPLSIAQGETSILEQYLTAVAAAERTIYLENQLLLCPFLVPSLDQALERGVDVTIVVPSKTIPEFARARKHPQGAPLFAMVDALSRHENFLMAALGATRDDGGHADIYVHAKVGVIDDEWATIGSANAMIRSFRDDTEMNVTTWDAAIASKLRRDLFDEHLHDEDGSAGNGSSPADDREAMRLLRERARENTARRAEGLPMDGRIYAIDPRRWAQP